MNHILHLKKKKKTAWCKPFQNLSILQSYVALTLSWLTGMHTLFY